VIDAKTVQDVEIHFTGGLKTRDWKTWDSQKCRVGKRWNGKLGTKLQDWKTRERHVWKAK